MRKYSNKIIRFGRDSHIKSISRAARNEGSVTTEDEDEANANEQKLIDKMDKLLIQNQAPVEQFKRLTKSFNEYKSRKPKTFKI